MRVAKLPFTIFLLFPCLLARGPAQTAPQNPPRSLFTQSAVQVLNRDFSDSNVSYLLFDAHSGVLLISRWDHEDKPIPIGSLVKPFTGLAYAEAHDYRYPTYECRGEASGCWRMQPHGSLDIVSAISVSCNSYFRSLARNVTSAELAPVTQDFHLESPGENIDATGLIGLGEQWRIAPVHIARSPARPARGSRTRGRDVAILPARDGSGSWTRAEKFRRIGENRYRPLHPQSSCSW
jgi:hypothetical protein